MADGVRTVTYGGYGLDGSTPTTLTFGSVMTAAKTYDGLNRLGRGVRARQSTFSM